MERIERPEYTRSDAVETCREKDTSDTAGTGGGVGMDKGNVADNFNSEKNIASSVV